MTWRDPECKRAAEAEAIRLNQLFQQRQEEHQNTADGKLELAKTLVGKVAQVVSDGQ